MALETGTYVSDLVATNPPSGDPVSQSDDHLRLIKSVLQSTFPAGSQAHYPSVSGTKVASTSGTSVDFTSIPSWVKRVTILLSGVSTSGSSNILFQIGDSGGIENTGYLGTGVIFDNTPTVLNASYTTGFGLPSANASNVMHGSIVIERLDAATNSWVARGNFSTSNTGASLLTSGSKSLSATLDRVRLTTVNGTDTFDAGSVNILYE